MEVQSDASNQSRLRSSAPRSFEYEQFKRWERLLIWLLSMIFAISICALLLLIFLSR